MDHLREEVPLDANRVRDEANRFQLEADRETDRIKAWEVQVARDTAVVEAHRQALAASDLVGVDQVAALLKDQLVVVHRERKCNNDPRAGDMVKAILSLGAVSAMFRMFVFGLGTAQVV